MIDPHLRVALEIGGGAAAGALASLLHRRLLARGIADLLERRRSSIFLLTAPLRVGLPALVLLGLALWGAPALLAGAAALALVTVISVARRVNHAADEPEARR